MAKFQVGSSVQVNALVTVRNGPALNATKLGTQLAGATGIIVEGPVPDALSGYVYFRVDFQSGVDGWCGEDRLSLTTPILTPRQSAEAKLTAMTWVPLTSEEAQSL